jgi:hypothetical protein
VPVVVHRDPFGPLEAANGIAVLTELAHEVAVGIEDLDPEVQRIGHVHVAVLIESDIGGQGKLSRARQGMVLARLADLAQRLQAVGVIHEHDVLFGIHHVEQTPLGVDRQPERIH